MAGVSRGLSRLSSRSRTTSRSSQCSKPTSRVPLAVGPGRRPEACRCRASGSVRDAHGLHVTDRSFARLRATSRVVGQEVGKLVTPTSNSSCVINDPVLCNASFPTRPIEIRALGRSLFLPLDSRFGSQIGDPPWSDYSRPGVKSRPPAVGARNGGLIRRHASSHLPPVIAV
jgi:hypothetical protein